MKPFKLIIIYLFMITAASAQNLNLMPIPQQVEITGGRLNLDHSFAISIKGNPDERLYPYATRVLRRLSGRTGLFFPQDVLTRTSNADTNRMLITVQRPGKVMLNEDESYSLTVTADKVELNAATDLGAMHGLETLLQLLDADSSGYYLHTVNIQDKPRFPWRGLMIDPSRHFMPVDMIKRNIDALSAMKMNVLHLHLSEDQGFRVESKVFPKLHELGSDGDYFTQEQIKDIIKYAADRGIRVYPEFDVPGHTTAWFAAYPEYASAPGPYTIERNWGVFDPTMDPTKEETYEFLDKLFGEMAALFPDEYFHIGGDENNGKQWDANPKIQEFMKQNNIADNHELQTYFNNRILKILTKYGKKMVGWDEILQPGMPNNIVIQSWRGTKALVEAAKKGYQSILSNGYYIDLIQPTDFHYLNDPVPAGSDLSEKELKLVLGGEATMWAELVTNETVDSRIWPRTAAIAERFWSSADVKDLESMYNRLEVVSFRLEELGLLHRKNYEMMLRRLTNNNDIAPLHNLIQAIEPVKIYTRHRQGVKYTQHSPYTRVVDAALPDAGAARNFRYDVDKYLVGEKGLKDEITAKLNLWKNNHDDLRELMNKAPVLKEIDSLSLNLSRISQAGLEAIDYINKNKTAPAEWVEKNLQLTEEAKKPYGQTEIMIVPAIEKLINRAGKKD